MRDDCGECIGCGWCYRENYPTQVRDEDNEDEGGDVRDKFLTEAMGECWHEWEALEIESAWECSTCKCLWDCTKSRVDFSTWEGFGKLWEWAQQQEWWEGFLRDNIPFLYQASPSNFKIIHPDRLTEAVYEFLKNKCT